MADNVAISAGAGTSIATDDIGGVHFQRVKIGHGADGAATDASSSAPFPVIQTDSELALTPGLTGLRDLLIAERYTVLADSLADGLAAFWTSTVANGGTATSSGGEGVIDTSANAAGAALIVSSVVNYYPGQVGWFNSAIRVGDTGSAGNIRRWGTFTLTGTTPQEGFYYELNGTTLNAVTTKAGVATATASTSWSKFSTAPFTLDTSFHFFEMRVTGNTIWFYIDNVLRHVASGSGGATISTTLNLPIALQSINTSGATSRVLGARNVGIGRFGRPPALAQIATLSNVAGSASSVQLLAANGSRFGATIANDSNQVLYVKLGTTASSTSYTVKMRAGDYYEVPFKYTGRIDGIWASANGNARITELS